MPYLYCPGSDWYFIGERSAQELTFVCTRNWQISCSESWCVASPASGKVDTSVSFNEQETQITKILVEPNPEYEERECVLTLTSGIFSKAIRIHQRPKSALIVPQTSFELSYAAQPFAVTTESSLRPGEIHITIGPDAVGWITKGGGFASTEATGAPEGTKALQAYDNLFSVTENTGSSERVGHISFELVAPADRFGEYEFLFKQEVTVRQAPRP